MNIITKLLGLGLMATTLTFTTSCSDDDDNNGIVYNQHSFDKAYNLEEAQKYVKSLGNEVFSSANLDTTDFKPFINDCRYFNDTYLKYASSNGEAPFDSILSNLTKFFSGDLSDLTSTLDRYKRYAGVYTANTTSKAWDKTADKNNSITLNFNDESGKNIQAKLVWLTFPGTTPEGVDNVSGGATTPNIITVTDKVGNVVTDTLPNIVEISITGGQHNLDFGGIATLEVKGTKVFNSKIAMKLKDYVVTKEKETTNTLSDMTLKVMKNEKVLFSSREYITGNNFLNYVVNPKTYPITERESNIIRVFLRKLMNVQTENKLLYRQKMNTLNASGLKLNSEEYVKQKVAITKEARTNIMYDVESNTYVGSFAPTAHYVDDKFGWVTLPMYTLHDNTTCLVTDMDKSGITSYLTSKFGELLSRLGALTGYEQ